MIAFTIKVLITIVIFLALAGSNHPAGVIGVVIDLLTAKR
jgi:hypothetical protein